MATPYLLPNDIQTQPLGVSWKSLGQPGGTQPSEAQNAAAILGLCQSASGLADEEMNQSQRAQLLSEDFLVTSHWASWQPAGFLRLSARYNPIVYVAWAAMAAAAQPYPKSSWVVLPSGAAYPERAPVGVYGTTAPSAVSGGENGIIVSSAFWQPGRQVASLNALYVHGWPHALTTAAIMQGATSITVSEVAGFIGASAEILDTIYNETVQVTGVTTPTAAAYSATSTYFPGVTVTYLGTTWQCTIANGPYTPSGVQSPPSSSAGSGPYWTSNVYPVGPGTLQLLTGTQYAHTTVPVLVTAMPTGIRWGMALYAKAQALERGLATVTVQGRDGKPVSSAEGIEDATVKAVAALGPFRRMV